MTIDSGQQPACPICDLQRGMSTQPIDWDRYHWTHSDAIITPDGLYMAPGPSGSQCQWIETGAEMSEDM